MHLAGSLILTSKHGMMVMMMMMIMMNKSFFASTSIIKAYSILDQL